MARLLALVVVATGLSLQTSPASADPGDIGYAGPSYSSNVFTPTADKPQSKLWFNDGFWWANMFHSGSGTWHIFRLNRASQTWVDTGAQVDNRPDTRSDALWDGSHLYISVNVVAASSSQSSTGKPARLYRYSYNSSTDTYALDAGFPVAINNVSSESMTIDKDSRGVLWATWTANNVVYVNSTNGTDSSWGQPFALGASGSANLASDDISSIVAYGRNKIGLMWSNQNTSTVYFAIHRDNDTRTTWTTRAAVSSSRIADDHINLKQLEGDDAGHVYAAVKTSLDGTGSSSAAQVLLLALNVSSGNWESVVFGTVADCHTRPMIVIDRVNSVLHMFATGPSTSSGCPGSGTPGTIYEKTTPLNQLAFPPGRGTPVIRDASSANVNDVTGTKQNITAASGLVILASNDATRQYWHADIPLTGSSPTVAFTASPASGTAPLDVAFTNTSTGSLTGWSWNFGDGTTSTQQSPSHTYTAAGTYTVTLTGTTASGTSASSSGTVQVQAPPPSGGGAVTFANATTTGQTGDTTSVTLAKPANTAVGDLLVASFTTNNGPSATPPAGWSPITSVTVSGAKLFAYSRVVTAADAGISTWTFTLSSGQKWDGGIARYVGVDPANPFDGAVRTGTGAASVTVPAVTTTTAGALLIGGVGTDSGSATANPPSGWTQAWQRAVAQMGMAAYKATTKTGSQGTTTWTQSKSVAMGAWTIPLRPKATP